MLLPLILNRLTAVERVKIKAVVISTQRISFHSELPENVLQAREKLCPTGRWDAMLLRASGKRYDG